MGPGDALVPVDDRAGDHSAAIGEQEDHDIGDLVHLAEFAHRLAGIRLIDPVVTGAVELALDGVFALRVRPADVESIDPHPVPPVGVCRVLGQPDQAGLGRAVGRQIGLTAVRRHRDDVDDGAGFAAAHHVGDGRLHRKEGTAQVDRNVLVEDWGGKYQSVAVSARSGLNVDTLLEKIVLEAEMLELKANPDRNARGTVIEAHLDKGKGVLATVMVQKGTLEVGDPFVAGMFAGRVRALFDERGNRVERALPSIPVQVSGFDGLPQAGDIFTVLNSESEARDVAHQRQMLKREQQFKQVRHITLDDISRDISAGGSRELRLIIKGDVGGSVEALCDSLLKLSSTEARVSILHKGVGTISESDVMLAAASSAVIIGFNVSPSGAARKASESEGVDIRIYNIIYDCINEIHLALEGLLQPDIKEEITANVEVRQVFKISRIGVIAGCYVQTGKITRNDKVRLLRDGLPIFKGALHSLKRIKDDVREVDAGYECGVALAGFNDIEVGDIIESYKITEVKRKLS